MITFPDPWDFALKIALAGFLGLIIGIERDVRNRPAGLRTNMLIAIGACLFGVLSSEGYADASGTQDPSRIASIVVQGIGFIGAGVILFRGTSEEILGVTTAATIWVVAAIGLAVGADLILEAVITTIVVLAALIFLRPFSKWLERMGEGKLKDT